MRERVPMMKSGLRGLETIVASISSGANPQFRTDCREPGVELFSKELLRGILKVKTNATNCIAILIIKRIGKIVRRGVHDKERV